MYATWILGFKDKKAMLGRGKKNNTVISRGREM